MTFKTCSEYLKIRKGGTLPQVPFVPEIKKQLHFPLSLILSNICREFSYHSSVEKVSHLKDEYMWLVNGSNFTSGFDSEMTKSTKRNRIFSERIFFHQFFGNPDSKCWFNRIQWWIWEE